MVLTESDSELERGDAAPDFDLPGADGDSYSLDDFADQGALLVVFTCNHCPYAEAKVDLLNDVAETYDDCAVVGINPNDSEVYPDDSFEEMQRRVESGEVAYDAYLRDDDGAVARTYGAVCTPDPFVFRNDDGTFRLAYHGRLDDAMDPDAEPEEYYVYDAVGAALAGEEVDHPDRPSRGCSIKWPEPDANSNSDADADE